MKNTFLKHDERVQWQWDNDGTWKSYDSETNDMIEAAKLAGQPTVLLTHGFYKSRGGYIVNFINKTQTNSETKYDRKIRRIVLQDGNSMNTHLVPIVPIHHTHIPSTHHATPTHPTHIPSPHNATHHPTYHPTFHTPSPTHNTTPHIPSTHHNTHVPSTPQIPPTHHTTSNFTPQHTPTPKILPTSHIHHTPHTTLQKSTLPNISPTPQIPPSKPISLFHFTSVVPNIVSTPSHVSNKTPPTKQKPIKRTDFVITSDDLPQEIVTDKVKACEAVTEWIKVDYASLQARDDCPICLCELDNDVVMLSKCKGHSFHAACISECFDGEYLKCPICSILYGVKTGTQPKGTMNVTFYPSGQHSLSGHENSGTIKIFYNIPNGIQGKGHPNPGVAYKGTTRTCYLPDTKEGNEVLDLLVIAFKRRLIFTVGTSVTNGTTDCVIWNGIHHKTTMTGGPTNYGYPDETYFERVKEELQRVGVVGEET